MFTGIVSHLGKIKKIDGSTFVFAVSLSFSKQIKKGSSVCVNGACFTTRKVGTNIFVVDLMRETLRRTAFSRAKVGDSVNLELPLVAGGRLDGHIVQGHVDYVADILSIKKEGNSYIFKFSTAAGFGKYLVEKGSVAVNGISLTVVEASKEYFTVGIIPHTLKHTTLGNAKMGDKVNIEVDIVAKYIEKLIKR